ncbi:MAG: rhomboid family intramembrane serine protease [Candidatus Planktophila sp.]
MKKPQSAVLTLITVICGFYLWELIDSGIINTLALGPIDYLKYTNEWYRLFSVALLHDTSSTLPFHLAFNMMALHQLGTPLEYVFGKTKFMVIFLFSLLTGSLLSTFLMAPNGYSIGASGAVFGLFGAFIAVGNRIGVEVKSIYAIVAINFAIGFTIGGVDWHAHLGGLIGGYLITKMLAGSGKLR